MSRRRPLRIVAAFAVGALLMAPGLASADTATPTPAAGGKVTFTMGWLTDIISANPFTGYLAEDYDIWAVMYPTLANYAQKDFEPVPGIAEIGVESADKKTWTYKIQSGLQWSDGVPLTAKDAAYTFNRIINGSYEQGNWGNYVKNVTKAEAPDDTTLVLTINQPVAFMRNLPIYIIPEHIWKDVSEKDVESYSNEPTDGNPIVGAGPFLLAERKTGQFIRLVANPTSVTGQPGVDEIVIRIFANADAMAQALKKGEIDFAEGLQANVFKSLQDEPNITTVNGKYPQFNELAFNTGAKTDKDRPIGDGNPLLQDVKLRQAIGWAIDTDALTEKVLGGFGLPADMVQPPMFSFWHTTPTSPRTFDPEKAKQLLDEAGYQVGADGIRRAENGAPLSFRLFGRSDSADSKKSVEFIKGYLADIGIEANVSLLGNGVLGERITTGTFDMFEWGWVADVDPNYMLSIFTCDKRSGDNDGGTPKYDLSDSFYCNPAFDTLYDEQAKQTDRTARQALVHEALNTIYDDAPYITTYYADSLEAYRSDKFTGFAPQPDPEGALFLQYGTYSYQGVKPVSVATPGGSGSGEPASSTNWALIGGLGALVLLLVGGGVAFGMRKSAAGADERE